MAEEKTMGLERSVYQMCVACRHPLFCHGMGRRDTPRAGWLLKDEHVTRALYQYSIFGLPRPHGVISSISYISQTFFYLSFSISFMDKSSSVIAALDAGKLPSTKQLSHFFNWLRDVGITHVEPSAQTELTSQGRVLANDVRRILDAYTQFLNNKNGSPLTV